MVARIPRFRTLCEIEGAISAANFDSGDYRVIVALRFLGHPANSQRAKYHRVSHHDSLSLLSRRFPRNSNLQCPGDAAAWK